MPHFLFNFEVFKLLLLAFKKVNITRISQKKKICPGERRLVVLLLFVNFNDDKEIIGIIQLYWYIYTISAKRVV